MKIFLISIPWAGYDTYNAHVIVANTEDEVRELAASACADEGSSVWSSAKVTIEGESSSTTQKPFILLSSFNAG